MVENSFGYVITDEGALIPHLGVFLVESEAKRAAVAYRDDLRAWVAAGADFSSESVAVVQLSFGGGPWNEVGMCLLAEGPPWHDAGDPRIACDWR